MNRALIMALTLAISTAGADGLRDPTRPPMPAAAPGTPVRETMPAVSAVFIADQSRRAIVDGRLVQAGDAVGDGKIEAVSASGVIWRRRGVAHELTLPKAAAEFKKPAAGPARKDNGVQ